MQAIVPKPTITYFLSAEPAEPLMTETPNSPSDPSQPTAAGPTTPPPRRRPGYLRIFWIVLGLTVLYLGYSFLTPTSMAEFKWAAAMDAFDAENTEEAKKLGKEAIEWAPENAELHLRMAELYFRLDEATDARIQLEEAIALAKDDPYVIRQASFLLSRMEQHDGALMLSDRLVDLSEKQQTIHMHQALNHRAYAVAMAAADDAATEEQVTDGLKDIERAIAIYGNDASYIDTRGYLKVFSGDLDGAMKDLDDAIGYFEAQRTKLLSQLSPEQVEEMPQEVSFADTQLKQVLAVLYSHRALAYEKLDEQDKAQEDHDRAESYGLDRKLGIW